MLPVEWLCIHVRSSIDVFPFPKRRVGFRVLVPLTMSYFLFPLPSEKVGGIE
jgi:hypothetical protein